MKIDPETKRLYKMEGTFMTGNMTGKLSLAKCQEIADKVCRRWRVPPVKVRFRKHRYWYGEYFCMSDVMNLYDHEDRQRPGHGRNMVTLLHELAHHIDDWKVDCRPSSPSHGPSFAAIAMELYDHYKVLPADAFKLLAKRFKVKIAPAVSPKMRKRKHARRR